MPSQTEIRQQITNQIVAALEQNQIVWRQPWRSSPNSGRPSSVASLRPYAGVNPLILQAHAFRHGFKSKYWGTWDQWKRWGCTVKSRPEDVEPGEWGARIVFYKHIKKTVVDQATGHEERDRFFVLKTWSVFNAEQVEGLVANKFLVSEEDSDANPFPDYGPAEELFAATGAVIHHEGEKAFYRRPLPYGTWPNHRTGDEIVVPEKNRFDLPGAFYETVCHELAHWSEVRLDWVGEYAEGELIAEIAATYLSAELRIPNGEDLSNHARYIETWLSAMRGDPRFIFRASSQASKVVDFLLGFVRQEQNQPAEVEVA